MRIVSYSDKYSNVQDVLDSFIIQCKVFGSVVYSIKQVLLRIEAADLSIITASNNDPKKLVYGTKDLSSALTELSVVQGKADENYASLKQIKSLLAGVLSRGSQEVVVETGVLDSILPKVRVNASELPGFIKEAEDIKHTTKAQVDDVVAAVKSTADICWKSISIMNSILDEFPIDRSNPLYSHLPENDSELL